METNYNSKKYDIKCAICHSIMKTRENDPRNIPLAVRTAKPAICMQCLNRLNAVKTAEEEEFNLPLMEVPKLNMRVEESNSLISASNCISRFLEISEQVKKDVKCQDSVIEQIMAILIKREMNPSLKSQHIMLIGNSGTGKTFLLSKIAENASIPISFEDATAYTEEGYVGNSVRDMLLNLYEKAGENLELAQNGIIVIDEGDKKKGRDSSGGRDVSGSMVLKSMLTMLDGKKVKLDNHKTKVNEFDTSKVLFIFMGAFEGLEIIREKRLKKNVAIGFAREPETKEIFQEYIPQDIIEYGIPREFVGRCQAILEMNKLEAEELFTILNYSKSSGILQEVDNFKSFGVDLLFDDEILKEFADKASKLNIGARALNQIILKSLSVIWHNVIYDNKRYNGRKVKLLPGITDDCYKYKVI